MYKNVPDVFVFAAIHGAFWPVGRAIGAHPGIAKLLAMLFRLRPSDHSRFAPLFKKRQDSRFSQCELPQANIMDDVSENRS